MYMNVDLVGYPLEWSVAFVEVCVTLWHSGGVGNALTLRVKEFSDHTPNAKGFLFKQRGGDARNITAACFSSAGAERLPEDDVSRAPYR